MNTDEAVSNPQTVVVAGATGDLGARITRALVQRGAHVRALLRADAEPGQHEAAVGLGAEPLTAEALDVDSVADVLTGAHCVVSALNGLAPVMLDRQSVLLDATSLAGVRRFIPSDFSGDFTGLTRGRNRNLDLRLEFMGRADRAPVEVTSVLNGAFMDMLGHEMPIIQPAIHRVLAWGSVDQPLNFTTKDDTAAFTAEVALDDQTPRFLRVSGGLASAAELAAILTTVRGDDFKALRVAPVGVLTALAQTMKTLTPGGVDPFPAWQGMQYMRDMFSGGLEFQPVDNERYPQFSWTRLEDHLGD